MSKRSIGQVSDERTTDLGKCIRVDNNDYDNGSGMGFAQKASQDSITISCVMNFFNPFDIANMRKVCTSWNVASRSPIAWAGSCCLGLSTARLLVAPTSSIKQLRNLVVFDDPLQLRYTTLSVVNYIKDLPSVKKLSLRGFLLDAESCDLLSKVAENYDTLDIGGCFLLEKLSSTTGVFNGVEPTSFTSRAYSKISIPANGLPIEMTTTLGKLVHLVPGSTYHIAPGSIIRRAPAAAAVAAAAAAAPAVGEPTAAAVDVKSQLITLYGISKTQKGVKSYIPSINLASRPVRLVLPRVKNLILPRNVPSWSHVIELITGCLSGSLESLSIDVLVPKDLTKNNVNAHMKNERLFFLKFNKMLSGPLSTLKSLAIKGCIYHKLETPKAFDMLAMKNLESLTIHFPGVFGDACTPGFLDVVAKLQNLQLFKINVNDKCTNSVTSAEWWNSLEKIKAKKTLEFGRFARETVITDVERLIVKEGIARVGLSVVRLCISGEDLFNEDFLNTMFTSCTNVKILQLVEMPNISKNVAIMISNAKNLSTIDFMYCPKIQTMENMEIIGRNQQINSCTLRINNRQSLDIETLTNVMPNVVTLAIDGYDLCTDGQIETWVKNIKSRQQQASSKIKRSQLRFHGLQEVSARTTSTRSMSLVSESVKKYSYNGSKLRSLYITVHRGMSELVLSPHHADLLLRTIKDLRIIAAYPSINTKETHANAMRFNELTLSSNKFVRFMPS